MNSLINKIIEKLEAGISKSDVAYYYVGKPYEISEAVLTRGAIIVSPVSTNVEPITTGIDDEETLTVEILLTKVMKNDFYKNAQKESGAQYLMRVVEGRDDCFDLLPNTIRYVLRNHQRELGLLQPQMQIIYDTQEVDNQAVANAVITLTTVQHISQPII